MEISEREAGGVVVLDLKGKLTLGEGGDELNEKVDDLLGRDKRLVLLNLAGVPYADSAGLGEVVRSYMTITRSGGSLKLLNLSERMRDVLRTRRLETVFEIFSSEAEAIESFQ